ncbi:MAG: AI-2E family transporter [Planctomycetota bacterium]
MNQPAQGLERIWRTLSFLVVAGIVLWFLGILSDVLIPFVGGFLLAYLLNPLVLLVQRGIKKRAVAVTLTLALVAGALGLAGWLVLPAVTREVAHSAQLLTRVAQDSELSRRAKEKLPEDLWKATQELARSEKVTAVVASGDNLKALWAAVQQMLPGAWSVIQGAGSFLMLLFGATLVGAYLFFILLDFDDIKGSFRSLIPPQARPVALSFLDEFEKVMSRHFRAQFVVCLMAGVLYALGLMLAGVPLGIVIGIGTGLLGMVPYLQAVGFLPAALFATVHALEVGSGVTSALGWVLAVFVVVQLIQDWVLSPKMVGEASGLNPAAMILSVSIWGKLLGFFGLVVAIPATCLFLTFYRRWQDKVENAAQG